MKLRNVIIGVSFKKNPQEDSDILKHFSWYIYQCLTYKSLIKKEIIKTLYKWRIII